VTPSQAVSTPIPSAIPAVMPGTPVTQQLQLHDIHLPEPVSNLPTAIGWWLLAMMIIFITFWLIKKLQRHKKLNQHKKHALSVLNNQKTLSNADIISLLKWSAMQYFSRQQVANLYGDAFQQFLRSQLPEKHQKDFEQLSSQSFIHQYQMTSTTENTTSIILNDDCRNAAKLWLSHALPPKTKTSSRKKQINGGLAHD
jgi:hypothetical protein